MGKEGCEGGERGGVEVKRDENGEEECADRMGVDVYCL